jgi:hypothetical protein
MSSIAFLFWWDRFLTQDFTFANIGTLLLEPCLQSILLWLCFGDEWSLVNYLPGLVWNYSPPNLSLSNT